MKRTRRRKVQTSTALETLEQRLALTPNLQIVDAYLMDGAGQRSTGAILGERVGVRFDFHVDGLPAGHSYSVSVTMDGVTKTRTMSHGAGSNPGSWWNGIAGWFVVDREYEVRVVLDAANDINESNESDNSYDFTFRPVSQAPHFKMVFPIPLEHSKEFTIGGYVDLNNQLELFNDYAGGRLAYDGHEGIDVNARTQLQAERGIPIVAAAAGTVKFARDGYSDFGGDGSSNLLVIDHGGGWETAYGHLRRDSVRVNEGDMVRQGERIAYMGGSGNGVIHLHFEMKFNGRDVDPNVSPDRFWEDPPQYSGDAKNIMLIKPTNYRFWEAHDQEASSSFSEAFHFTQGAPETPKFYARLTGLLPEDEVF